MQDKGNGDNMIKEKYLESNNLFQFATSELSQDAMICWICNNINFKARNERLYDLARKVISLFLEVDDLAIEYPVKIIRQFKKIDVLLVINNTYAVLIEDKTYTTEHDQFGKYSNALLNISSQDRDYYGLPKFLRENIKTVYLKTGFHYPYDANVKADCVVDGVKWYELLSPYVEDSPILRDYVIKLTSDLNSYREIESHYRNGDIFKSLGTHYGQYLLLKDMFDNLDDFAHGSSYGRPWSNRKIYQMPYGSTDFGDFIIFCRIDRKKDYYYASIRQYDGNLDKKNRDMMDKKKEVFYSLRAIFEESCVSIGEKKYTLGGNNGGFYESEIGFFKIGDDSESINLNELPTRFGDFVESFIMRLDNFKAEMGNC